MGNTSSFLIGGLEFFVHMDEDRAPWEIPSGYQPFVIPGPIQPAVELDVEVAPLPQVSPQQYRYESGDVWRMASVPGGWMLVMQSDVVSREPYQLAFLDENFSQGKVIFSPQVFPNPASPFPLSNPFGEVLAINMLSRIQGLIVHACGVYDGGKGLLFTAHSEVGKTTTARLWMGEGAKILNDDRIILRRQDDHHWMYSTPWHGDLAHVENHTLPLHAVFVLRQAEYNQVRRLRPIEAISSMLSRSFPTYWDPRGIEDCVDFLEGLCLKVPVFDLGFVPDVSAVEFVRDFVHSP